VNAATAVNVIGGVNVAAVTPRGSQGKEADLGAALELIDYLCGAGARGIALLGSTGEFLNLGFDERVRLVYLAAKRSRVPIYAGVAHSSLDGAVELAREARDAGAAGVLLMPPYFFRYGQAEIHEFFLQFANQLAGTVPIVLYNVPFFTNELACGTALDLLETGMFAGIKDSSGSLEYFERLKEASVQQRFAVIIGNDAIFTRARLAGADGVVSGVACAVPELMLALDRAIQCGQRELMVRLEARLQEFIAWLDRFPAPVGIRVATAARGLKVGPLAAPLAARSQRALEEFSEWFQSWLPAVKGEASAI